MHWTGIDCRAGCIGERTVDSGYLLGTIDPSAKSGLDEHGDFPKAAPGHIDVRVGRARAGWQNEVKRASTHTSFLPKLWQVLA